MRITEASGDRLNAFDDSLSKDEYDAVMDAIWTIAEHAGDWTGLDVERLPETEHGRRWLVRTRLRGVVVVVELIVEGDEEVVDVLSAGPFVDPDEPWQVP